MQNIHKLINIDLWLQSIVKCEKIVKNNNPASISYIEALERVVQ